MTDEMKLILGCLILGGIGLSLACTLTVITVAFPKIREIERIISVATLTSSSGHSIWGGDPIGRLIRTTHIFMYLLMRNIPGHFRRAAGNVGDVDAKIPRHLFLWALLPMLGMYLFLGIAFCGGSIVD